MQKELDAQEPLLINDVPVGSKEWNEKNKTQITIHNDDSQETLERTSSYQNFHEGMVKAILSGTPVPVDAHEIVSVMEIVERIYKIIRNNLMTS